MPKGIRTTQNVVRKAVFDILGQDMAGVSFLELFAGSGAMGLEAISRGAKQVVLVERDYQCYKVIEENWGLLGISKDSPGGFYYEVFKSDVFIAIKQLARFNRKFNIIFMDPPYGEELAKKALNLVSSYDIVHADSFLIIQHEKREILPETSGRFLLYKHNKYGSTCLAIYRRE